VRVLRPVLVGAGLAFVLNILLRRLRPLFRRGALARRPRLADGLSLAATYLVFLGAAVGILLFILPQLAESLRTFAANLETYYNTAVGAANSLAASVDPALWAKLDLPQRLNSLYQRLPALLEAMGGGLVAALREFAGGLMDTMLGLLISVYLLAGKDHMKRQFKRALAALLPQRQAAGTGRLLRMVEQTFSAFIGGQCVEALILGTLCFIGMNIFGFAYAPLVSVIVGVTNLIPIVGPILGTIPCALLLLLVDPVKALWFVVFIIVLQQLESNLIYPRVVGTSVGLPAFWVLLAVIVGGGLGGVAGMVIGIPTMAILHRLAQEALDRREAVQPSPERTDTP